MIAGERRYRITRAWITRFEQGLSAQQDTTRRLETDLHPRLVQAIGEAIESELLELRQQLAQYDERASRG
jgi:hypothetical protein